LPAKPKWLRYATTVSRKRLILKNWPENVFFFIFKASGDCGENFVKIGDDFGAGRLRVKIILKLKEKNSNDLYTNGGNI
jgi:hypothetical protein